MTEIIFEVLELERLSDFPKYLLRLFRGTKMVSKENFVLVMFDFRGTTVSIFEVFEVWKSFL